MWCLRAMLVYAGKVECSPWNHLADFCWKNGGFWLEGLLWQTRSRIPKHPVVSGGIWRERRPEREGIKQARFKMSQAVTRYIRAQPVTLPAALQIARRKLTTARVAAMWKRPPNGNSCGKLCFAIQEAVWERNGHLTYPPISPCPETIQLIDDIRSVLLAFWAITAINPIS